LKSLILTSLTESLTALEGFIKDESNIETIEAAATLLIHTLQNNGAIYSCGNGGSMSDAMHFAEELTGRYRNDRPGLAATAISDPGHLTCVANDFGYEHVFSRYLEARAKSGDTLVAISTSGKSKNVINAAEFARENGISVISLTGPKNTPLGKIATVDISTINYQYADKIQEIHIKVLHILIEQIERVFFPDNYNNQMD
jgi:D-sedoheptulose 7-phosphate isomerase